MPSQRPADVNAYLDIPITPPVPAGEGPFHMKGSSFRATAKNIDASVPGGLAAVLDRLGDDRLKAFWSTPFLAGGWYDVFGMVAVVGGVARVRGVPYFTAVGDLSRMLAIEDTRGLYRALLVVASPEFIAPRLPRIQSRYLDFGGVVVGKVTKGYCEVTRTQHPAILTHWFCGLLSGFMPCVLEQSGAKDVKLRWDRPKPDGSVSGYDTVSMRFEVQWK
jgi:hypothetical protein